MKNKRILWGLGLSASFFLFVFWLTYPKIKLWRAEKLFEKGEVLAQTEQREAAIDALYASYQLAPENQLTIERLALLLQQDNPRESLSFWKLLTTLQPAEYDYWEKYLQTALSLNDLALSRKIWEDIQEKHPTEIAHADLYRAQLFILEGELREAIRLLEEMAISDLTWQQLQPLWEIVLPQNEKRAEKYRFFQEQLQRDNLNTPQIEELLRISNQHAWLIPEEKISHFFSSGSATQIELQKKLLSYGMRHYPDNDRWWEEAQKLFPIETIEERKEFSVWLRQARRPDLGLSLWSTDTAMARRDTFLVYLDLLADLDDWQTIRTLVQKDVAPLEEFLQLAFLAHAQNQLGQETRFELTWQKAIRATLNKPESLIFLSDFADRYSYKDAQLAVLDRLKTSPQLLEIAYHREVILHQKEKDTVALQKTLQEMAKKFPHNEAVQNDLAYTTLLITPSETAGLIPSISKRVETYPNVLSYRVTLALAYLHTGEYQAAEGVTNIQNLDWTSLRSSWKLVRACALWANQNIVAAEKVLSSLRENQLLPEEKALLEKIRSL